MCYQRGEGRRAGVVHAEITGVRKKNVWSTKASFINNKEELDMLNNDVRVNKWLSIEYRDGPQSGKWTSKRRMMIWATNNELHSELRTDYRSNVRTRYELRFFIYFYCCRRACD